MAKEVMEDEEKDGTISYKTQEAKIEERTSLRILHTIEKKKKKFNSNVQHV